MRSALQSFSRPAVVVADARSALQPPVKRSSRDAELQQAVLGALQEGGSVLMPVDATGRVLELLVHLEEVWGGGGDGENKRRTRGRERVEVQRGERGMM